ncbi:hypothetical protein WJX84_005742 [Apatococcus fuscideae]|uniref:Gamma tubulin complex component C-terminal domain-containing protein n=1 Tax=Apatococcus fuscideae TaxID=2026836 RepID=A0AAW1TAB7_9CHLO
MDESDLADLSLLALQGIQSAISQISSGLLATPNLRPGCIWSLLQPLVKSGRTWSSLEQSMTFMLAQPASAPDPCLQAFAAAVQGLLQRQASALQGLPEAIAERRRGDAVALVHRASPMCAPSLTPSLHLSHSELSTGAALPRLTLLEIVVHTEKLRADLDTLEVICQLGSDHQNGLHEPEPTQDTPSMVDSKVSSLTGPALMTWLHDHLLDADASTTPLLQELLCATAAPFLAHMEAWAFTTGCLPSVHPDWVSCSTPAGSLQAVLHPQDSNHQGMPGELPSFLRSLEPAFVQTGLQLRMLQRLHTSAAATADRMCASAAAEAADVSCLVAGQATSAAWQPATNAFSLQTLSFNAATLLQVVARQALGVAERQAASMALLHDREEAGRMQKAKAQEVVLQARQLQSESRQVLQLEREAASSRARLSKLGRLRGLQAAAQARKTAEAAERAQARATEQDLLEAEASRELERTQKETEEVLRRKQAELSNMTQQAARASWQGSRWSLASSRSSHHQAREAQESAEASRRTSAAGTPASWLSPADLPQLQPHSWLLDTNAPSDAPSGMSSSHLLSEPPAAEHALQGKHCGFSTEGTLVPAATAGNNPEGMLSAAMPSHPAQDTEAVHGQNALAPQAGSDAPEAACMPSKGGSLGSRDREGSPSATSGVGPPLDAASPTQSPSGTRAAGLPTNAPSPARQASQGSTAGLSGRVVPEMRAAGLPTRTPTSPIPAGLGTHSGEAATTGSNGGDGTELQDQHCQDGQLLGPEFTDREAAEGASGGDEPVGHALEQRLVEKLGKMSGGPVRAGLLQGPPAGLPNRGVGSVPVAAVIEAYISDRILAQHRCVSLACVRMLVDELGLPALLHNLRSVYLAAAGDFFSALAEGLAGHVLQHTSLTERHVRDLLESSCKGSSIQFNALASSLQTRLQHSTAAAPDQSMGPNISTHWVPFVTTTAASLGALDCVALHVPIEWPLSAVVGGHELWQYQAIFSRLLCLQRPLVLLTSLWRHFSSLQGTSERHGGGDCVVTARLGQLQAAQQEAAHFVQALQASTQQGLLWVAWQRLQARLQDVDSIVDVMDLKRIHAAYLEDAAWACLLHPAQASHRAAADSCLQAILNLYTSFRQVRPQDTRSMLKDNTAWAPIGSAAKAIHFNISQFVRLFSELPMPARLGQKYADLVDFSRFYSRSV